MEITIQINGQALPVEVSIEVYTYRDQAAHKDENLAHEQRRHWDMRELDECIIAQECSRSYILTPEQIGRHCGCSKVAVHHSISAVRKNIKILSIGHLTKRRFRAKQ